MEYYAAHIETILDYLATRPFTLVHGDYHPKQMFFPTAEGGNFAVIDWQFSFVAQGAWDLARIVVTGQDAASRRERESALITQYHDGIKARGVEDYSREALEDDFRLGILVNRMIMMIAIGGYGHRAGSTGV
ncbi:MAG: oxidoreductase family protein [Gammaproteobacteria bacterium]|nr:oxidoreductase family protein [Gammaproteobacteria bacterium]